MLDLDELETRMKQAGYVPEPGLTTSIALMDVLSRPLLLEGDAGVGKTEVGKMTAQAAVKLHERTLNGVDVGKLRDTIHAVKEDPEIAKFKFRIKNKWTTGGDARQRLNRYLPGRSPLPRLH